MDTSELIILYNDENAVNDDILVGFQNYNIKTVPFSKRQEQIYLMMFVA